MSSFYYFESESTMMMQKNEIEINGLTIDVCSRCKNCNDYTQMCIDCKLYTIDFLTQCHNDILMYVNDKDDKDVLNKIIGLFKKIIIDNLPK